MRAQRANARACAQNARAARKRALSVLFARAARKGDLAGVPPAGVEASAAGRPVGLPAALARKYLD